ncbi:MAG: PRC-barrel domain-containing protein [Actinomycetota bacterium]|nr:PRC-barrel domain-containing protein [Actinomycetota bacterium]
MIVAEHLEAWRGQPVLDPSGEQLGKLDEVYLDARNEDPILISVKSGLLGRQKSLIPVDRATVGPDFLRVAHDRETVEGVGVDHGDGPPDSKALSALGVAYGLRFAPQLQLEAATDVEARRAAAREAHRRAAELEAEAGEKEAERTAAHERARGADYEAGDAARDAVEARRAADEARREAERRGGKPETPQ